MNLLDKIDSLDVIDSRSAIEQLKAKIVSLAHGKCKVHVLVQCECCGEYDDYDRDGHWHGLAKHDNTCHDVCDNCMSDGTATYVEVGGKFDDNVDWCSDFMMVNPLEFEFKPHKI